MDKLALGVFCEHKVIVFRIIFSPLYIVFLRSTQNWRTTQPNDQRILRQEDQGLSPTFGPHREETCGRLPHSV